MVMSPRRVCAAFSALIICAATLVISSGPVGASSLNPAGMSCTVTPNDVGVNETITFDFNGDTRTVVLRKITTEGSTYLVTLNANSEVSASINPLGYLIRYRQQGQVYDIPCEAGTNPPPNPEPSDNPAGVSCEYFTAGNDELVMLIAGPTGKAVHLRQIGVSGSSTYVATVTEPNDIGVPDGSEYFARYRQSGVVYDIDCVRQPV